MAMQCSVRGLQPRCDHVLPRTPRHRRPFTKQRLSCSADEAGGRHNDRKIHETSSPSRILLDRRAVLGSLLLAPLLATSSAEAAKLSKGAKVFVAGATGNTGRRVVQQLSQQGFTVLAGTRDEKKAQSLGFSQDKNIQTVKFNLFDPESIANAIGDADAVVSALGYSGFNPNGYKDVDLTGNANLVEGAKKSGVKKFVLLTSLLTNAKAVGQSDNPNYKFLNLFGGGTTADRYAEWTPVAKKYQGRLTTTACSIVLDNKLEAEKVLRSSGLDWTIVRPGGLSNEAAQNLGNLYVSREDTLFGTDGDVGRSISRDTVAEVMVSALKQDKAKNKVVEIVAGKKAPELPENKWFDV